jgi:hypothetical protein
MVKIFTMVKDEADIVEEWIIYHGCTFGWNNIYIIDNYSTDGTFEIINKFQKLINISREENYKHKGLYMKNLINKYCSNNDIAFPIDIDEFIVYFDNNTINVDKNIINNYINNLKESRIYKANYINIVLTCEEGFKKAIKEIDYGTYYNMGTMAKSFFNIKYYNGEIDHGNHINCEDYFLTKICLVHYHARNLEQIKNKVLNNITGLGYLNNLDSLKNIIKNNPICEGNHHVKNQINILENKFKLNYRSSNSNDLILTPLKNKIINGYF